tara:strand:+ start:1094 stop:1408 length:315 start_codon:yes stop_codon:yes gene_type:complete
MPGYGKTMEKYAPTTTTETKELKDRFSMPVIPQLTIVQMIIAAVIVAYAFMARKIKGVVVGTLALTIGLLHMYDHLYRVQRGPEKLVLFGGDSTEKYCAGGCGK